MGLSLALQVHVDVSLLDAPEGRNVGVVFNVFGRGVTPVEMCRTPLAADVMLHVEPPPPSVWMRLDHDMGGPFAYALGYVVVSDATGVLAVHPAERVLYLEGPFPVERFARWAATQTVADDARATALASLAQLPAGLSLVRAGPPSKSLVGFAPVDVPRVTLSRTPSLPWPPRAF